MYVRTYVRTYVYMYRQRQRQRQRERERETDRMGNREQKSPTTQSREREGERESNEIRRIPYKIDLILAFSFSTDWDYSPQGDGSGNYLSAPPLIKRFFASHALAASTGPLCPLKSLTCRPFLTSHSLHEEDPHSSESWFLPAHRSKRSNAGPKTVFFNTRGVRPSLCVSACLMFFGMRIHKGLYHLK
jgi:hypothetical protein